MKTLKEPQEPLCPPFPLPLSPLSRRPRVAFCAFNQQLFLSSRDLMRVFFVPTLSLSLAKQPKREPETTFFGSKSTKSASFLHQNGGKKDLSLCFFIFVVSTDPTAGIRIKKIRKNQAIFKSKLSELHHNNNPARADEL